MSETATEVQLIKKIESHEGDFIGIYRQVYPSLKGADRSNLPADVTADLDNLDPPDSIQPAKAAAILKSIMGSTAQDRFRFEYCFGVKLGDGKSLGVFVADQLRRIGIGYHDFWPYLRQRGWLKDE